jgi:hypothetical protein
MNKKAVFCTLPACPACGHYVIWIDRYGLESCLMCDYKISYFIRGLK